MDRLVTALTVHEIPGKEICGVVVLEQQADQSWTRPCSRCAKTFHHDQNPIFERQVFALRIEPERPGATAEASSQAIRSRRTPVTSGVIRLDQGHQWPK